MKALGESQLFKIPKDKIERLILDVPQFGYLIRKFRVEKNVSEIDWLRGFVDIH